MKYIKYFFGLAIFCSNPLLCQNLFPNPDFEQRDSCPYDMSQVKFSKGWLSASATPDFFNCTYRGNVVTTSPSSGDGYMCMLGGKQAVIQWYYYTELIKAKLTSPLIKGRRYRASFRCGLDFYGVPDSFLDFGLFFYSNKLLPDSQKHGCIYTPQISVSQKELTNVYKPFEFCFLADQNYDSVMIGPFCNQYSSLMPNVPTSLYYFMLDDVELRLTDTADFTADKRIFCDSSFVNFSITKFNATEFLWKFPGATPDSIPNYGLRAIWYNKPGKYDVILISNGICQDTLIKKNFIEVISTGTKINLIQDTLRTICKIDSSIINTIDDRVVTWGNGQKTSSLKVKNAGFYTCKFFTGCDTVYDTIRLQFIPSKDFSADNVQFCDSGKINFNVINSSASDNYLWNFSGGIPMSSTLTNPKNIFYQTEGKFDVRLIIDGLCKDTILKQNYIQIIQRLSDRNLIAETEVKKCDYETIVIKTKNNVEVKWSTGEVGSTISIINAGKYYCNYINFCDTLSDTILVSFRSECPCEAFLPNSFSPNNDQTNDNFKMDGYGDNILLNIYNRVGEKVFSSTDRKFLWDGKFKGKLVPQGVFIYTLKYTNCLKLEKNISGSINVLY